MKNRIHYAWIICIASALMMFLSYGVLANVFSVYVPTIVSDNGFSYSQGTMLSTVRSLSSLGTAVLVNYLVGKMGVRRLCLISIVLMVVSRLLFVLGGAYPVYVAASAIAGVSYVISGVVPTSVLIGNWFLGSRNLALGLTSAGSGLANILLSPLITESLKEFGLSKTFLFEGALILLVGSFIVFILKNRPEDKNVLAYGADFGKANDFKEKSENEKSGSSEKIVGTYSWILVLISCFLFAAPANAAFLNLTVLFDSFGYDKTVIGWLISFFGLTMIIGKIMMGYVYDKIGGFRANFIVGVCSAVAMFIFSACLDGVHLFFPVFALTILGVGQILSTITQPVWARDLRGGEGFSKAVSQLTFSFMLGSFVHNYITGFIVEKTGSYVPAYYMCFALVIIGMIMLQGVYLSARKM